MITQKAISAKIEHGVLEELERESFMSGKKKNRIINDAIRMYIDMQDFKRYLGCVVGKGPRDSMMSEVFHRNDLERIEKYILYER